MGNACNFRKCISPRAPGPPPFRRWDWGGCQGGLGPPNLRRTPGTHRTSFTSKGPDPRGLAHGLQIQMASSFATSQTVSFDVTWKLSTSSNPPALPTSTSPPSPISPHARASSTGVSAGASTALAPPGAPSSPTAPGGSRRPWAAAGSDGAGEGKIAGDPLTLLISSGREMESV